MLETAKLLRSHGLVVEHAVVLLNREQGGEEILARHGIKLHSFCRLKNLLNVLKANGRYDAIYIY